SRFLFAWFCVCVFPRPPRSSLFPYTTLFRSQVQHRLVDVESAAAVAGIDEVAHMRTGAAGQVQVPLAAVAKQLLQPLRAVALRLDRKSTRLNSSHVKTSYAAFCSKKKESAVR